MLMTDEEIRRSKEEGEFSLEPFGESCLQPASYDLRVGNHAFAS